MKFVLMLSAGGKRMIVEQMHCLKGIVAEEHINYKLYVLQKD